MAIDRPYNTKATTKEGTSMNAKFELLLIRFRKGKTTHDTLPCCCYQYQIDGTCLFGDTTSQKQSKAKAYLDGDPSPVLARDKENLRELTDEEKVKYLLKEYLTNHSANPLMLAPGKKLGSSSFTAEIEDVKILHPKSQPPQKDAQPCFIAKEFSAALVWRERNTQLAKTMSRQ